MKNITIEDLKIYEKFLYNRGRDIEIAKFNYHFNNGSREDVATALSIYQNRDGGFGHGLEPDSLNPYSSPLQTSEALKVLRHIGYDDSNLEGISEHLVYRALHYIYYYCVVDGKINPNVLSNNDYPHAKWWEYDENFFETWKYNPTAILVAMTLHFTKENDKYYNKAYELVPAIIESFLAEENEGVDKHYLVNLISLYEVITRKNIFGEYHDQLKENINQRIEYLMDKDENKWNEEDSTQPLEVLKLEEFINTKERRDLVQQNLDYLFDNRDDHGLFKITWNWNNDYEEFELQKIKWLGVLLVDNLVAFKYFNRIINND